MVGAHVRNGDTIEVGGVPIRLNGVASPGLGVTGQRGVGARPARAIRQTRWGRSRPMGPASTRFKQKPSARKFFSPTRGRSFWGFPENFKIKRSDVRFFDVFVRFTPNSGRKSLWLVSAVFDP